MSDFAASLTCTQFGKSQRPLTRTITLMRSPGAVPIGRFPYSGSRRGTSL
jgi:hypothetical protein